MGKKELSRRGFFKLLGLGALGAGMSTVWGNEPTPGTIENAVKMLPRLSKRDGVFKIDIDRDDRLNFRQASQLAGRLDRIFDRFPVPEFRNTALELAELTKEIVPQFEYEGIVEHSRYPKSVVYKFFQDGELANHLLGTSDCQTFAEVNGRLTLDISTFNQNQEVFTIAHELAHIQQGQRLCESTDIALLENSAQLAAMEVVCGLANQGNPRFLWAALNELRGMAMSAAYGLALQENRYEAYHDLRSRLTPGAMAEARFQKIRRRWADDQEKMKLMIDRYCITPLNMMMKAIRFNNCRISGLAFPERHFVRGFIYSRKPLPIVLDDTAYLLSHLEEMVEWAADHPNELS